MAYNNNITACIVAGLVALFTTSAVLANESNKWKDRTARIASLDNDKSYTSYEPTQATFRLKKPAHSELNDALNELSAHGLDADYYTNRFNMLSFDDRAGLINLVTDVVADLRFGATRDSRDWESQHPIIRQKVNDILRCHDLSACFQRIAARHPQYEPLQMMLTAYQRVAQIGGWPKIAKGPTLKPGMIDVRVPTIQSFLTLTGDYRAGGPRNTHYHDELADAVKIFQDRHGLAVDGDIGPATLAAMNIPIEDRIGQIELTLERLRLLPQPTTGHYVHVNLPSYELTAYEGTAKKLQMDVIIGKKSRPTPMFDNAIHTVGLNPTWTPTQRILSKDLLPKFQRDPSYASRGGYTIRDRHTGERLEASMVDWYSVSAHDVQVVQRPGRRNALGKVKFLLPKNDSVYLHDTSSPRLFKKSMRALSSGCIRLSDPEAFLDYVIMTQPDTRFEKLRRYYAASTNRHVSLDQPLPVTTTYFTSWINDSGQIEFYDDVYRKDHRLQLALEKTHRQLAMR